MSLPFLENAGKPLLEKIEFRYDPNENCKHPRAPGSFTTEDVYDLDQIPDEEPPRVTAKRFIGVTYHARNDRFVAQASESGRSKYLGTYTNIVKAAKVS